MNPTTTLAERLVMARTNSGLSQAVTAEKVGMSQSGYAALERGAALGTTYIARLARLFAVNAYWLETGLGEQYDSENLSQQERLMLEMMRAMKPARRALLLEFVVGTSNERPK